MSNRQANQRSAGAQHVCETMSSTRTDGHGIDSTISQFTGTPRQTCRFTIPLGLAVLGRKLRAARTTGANNSGSAGVGAALGFTVKLTLSRLEPSGVTPSDGFDHLFSTHIISMRKADDYEKSAHADSSRNATATGAIANSTRIPTRARFRLRSGRTPRARTSSSGRSSGKQLYVSISMCWSG